MDLGTLIGFVLAIVIILAAILLGGSILLFIDVPSIFIVFGGTIGVTLIKFKMSSLVETFGIAFKSVFFESQESPREIVQVATQVAQIVQRVQAAADVAVSFLKAQQTRPCQIEARHFQVPSHAYSTFAVTYGI